MVALWWFSLGSCVVAVRGQRTGNDIWEGGRDIGCKETSGLDGRHMILMDGLHNVFSQHGEDLLLVAEEEEDVNSTSLNMWYIT